MEDYNKIIESLNVHFKKANNIIIIQPINIENYYDVENAVFRVNQGEMRYGKEKSIAKKGDILFIPGGKNVPITFGSGSPLSLSNDDFISKKEQYFKGIKFEDIRDSAQETFGYVNFDAKVFDSVNFFASLDLPPFIVTGNKKMHYLLDTILQETHSNIPGHERVIKLGY